jgi:hypothetical protein
MDTITAKIQAVIALYKEDFDRMNGEEIYKPITPDGDYKISGNRISVKTLDLSQPFGGIQAEVMVV